MSESLQPNDFQADVRRSSQNSLARGITFLIGLTLVQRAIGMARQVLFCGILSDEELGRWSLAFNFLVLAAPLAVLGIPGSFGRYVEHYRTRHQLRAFLRRTTAGFLVPSGIFVAVVWFNPAWFSWLLFKDPQYTQFIRGVAVALVLLIVFNAFTELLMAMRLVRAATLTHFVNSFTFTGLAMGSFYLMDCREQGLIVMFILSTIAAGLVGLLPFVNAWKALPAHESALDATAMWGRVLPYAGWIWLGNIAANLFEMADQFLIKHWTGVTPLVADAMLGQYYTSRVIPNVMNSVAVLLGSSLLPHLVANWERGHRDRVSQRLNLWMKAIAATYTILGAVGLWIAPTLFELAFKNKYDVGVSLMPYTMVYCVWFGMAAIAQRGLACAERSSLITASLAISLAVNVGVNFLLLPVMGLKGAVLSAAIGHFCDLLVTFYLNRKFGLKVDLGVWVASALPCALCLGSDIALVMALLFLVVGLFTDSTFFTNQERVQLLNLWRPQRQAVSG